MSEERPRRHLPYPLNAPGPFYSENDGCITCGAPHAAAPELMAWYLDPSGTNRLTHCFFKRQPVTPEEVEAALQAMHASCVENLRYGGDDPAILDRLCRMGYIHLCDALTET
jgi:hypothetical protein